LSDRILVLSRGEIAAEFSRSQFDREQILRAALSSHERREPNL
jgi:ABC-type sugar transport system ATPase subunit